MLISDVSQCGEKTNNIHHLLWKSQTEMYIGLKVSFIPCGDDDVKSLPSVGCSFYKHSVSQEPRYTTQTIMPQYYNTNANLK